MAHDIQARHPLLRAAGQGIVAGLVLAILSGLLIWFTQYREDSLIHITSGMLPWIIAVICICGSRVWHLFNRQD